MRINKKICLVLVFAFLMGMISIPAKAVEIGNTTENFVMSTANMRASGSFSMSIAAKTKSLATSSFPLEAGETVTINASYSPFSANVDFGLVAPDGKFYYFNITDGSINKTIKVSERGNYTLQIRNNSDVKIEVSGFVNY